MGLQERPAQLCCASVDVKQRNPAFRGPSRKGTSTVGRLGHVERAFLGLPLLCVPAGTVLQTSQRKGAELGLCGPPSGRQVILRLLAVIA